MVSAESTPKYVGLNKIVATGKTRNRKRNDWPCELCELCTQKSRTLYAEVMDSVRGSQ